jgi:hypothetical protein
MAFFRDRSISGIAYGVYQRAETKGDEILRKEFLPVYNHVYSHFIDRKYQNSEPLSPQEFNEVGDLQSNMVYSAAAVRLGMHSCIRGVREVNSISNFMADTFEVYAYFLYLDKGKGEEGRMAIRQLVEKSIFPLIPRLRQYFRSQHRRVHTDKTALWPHELTQENIVVPFFRDRGVFGSDKLWSSYFEESPPQDFSGLPFFWDSYAHERYNLAGYLAQHMRYPKSDFQVCVNVGHEKGQRQYALYIQNALVFSVKARTPESFFIQCVRYLASMTKLVPRDITLDMLIPEGILPEHAKWVVLEENKSNLEVRHCYADLKHNAMRHGVFPDPLLVIRCKQAENHSFKKYALYVNNRFVIDSNDFKSCKQMVGAAIKLLHWDQHASKLK